MHRSIRARIALTAVGVMALTVAIASFALVTLLRQSLLNDVDARAKLRLEDVTALVESDEIPAMLAGDDEDSTVAQITSGDQVVAQSPIVNGRKPLTSFTPTDRTIDIRIAHDVPVTDASEFRVASRAVDTPRGRLIVYAAASTEPVTDSIRTLELLLAVVAPALVLIVGGLTWWLVGRTLDPVEAIRRQVADISASHLEKRVPEPNTADEIQRLALTMNDMLQRLEASVRKQRAFVSDAAHELRSPLAAIRADLEVSAAHRSIDDWTAVVERLTRGARRMETLVEDLLLVATSDEQGIPRHTAVDLDEVVIRQVEQAQATSGRSVELRRVDGARVSGDRDQIERVVANLLDNAARHADRAIAVQLVTDDSIAELVVEDDGSGIPVELRQRVFDRFARLDESRDRNHGGAGLGLAIARRIVEDHDGSIELADSAHGARFVVRLPLLESAERD